MSERLTRQQIYDRIRETSRDQYILEEMIRLGFWPEGKEQPTLAESLIRREGELNGELQKLLKQQRFYDNRERVLKEIRAKKLKESREKQAQNKLLRKQAKEEKAKAWQEKKERDIIYLGENVSSDLQDNEYDLVKLKQHNLPVFEDIADLAKNMGISVGLLRFLCFDRKVSKVSHYQTFFLPKKSGGQRLISAPMPKLKAAQNWVLENVLYKLPDSDFAHGFVKERSILSNAQPHVGNDLVVNIDLQDFFPSVHYKRIKALFKSLGYSYKMASVFALLCSESKTEELEIDGQRYYMKKGERVLPQGAPTSPALTNILCQRLDRRIVGAIKSLGFNYTRYADDMTFSAQGDAKQNINKLLWRVKSIIKDEGFTIHPDKLKIMNKGACQEVTGIVVNEKLNVNRKNLDKFRALLFQIEKDGPEGKHWNGSHDLMASIKGYADFIKFVNPEKGEPIVKRVKAILEKYNYRHTIRHYPKKEEPVETVESLVDEVVELKTAFSGFINRRLIMWGVRQVIAFVAVLSLNHFNEGLQFLWYVWLGFAAFSLVMIFVSQKIIDKKASQIEAMAKDV